MQKSQPIHFKQTGSIIISNQFFAEFKGKSKQAVKATLTDLDLCLQFQKDQNKCLRFQLQDIFIQVLQTPVKKIKTGFQIYIDSQYIILRNDNEEIIKNWIKNLSKHILPSNFQENYKSIQRLGEGSFGQVWKVQRKNDGKIFAAKLIKKDKIKKNVKILKNQINILKMLNHKNLVSQQGVYSQDLYVFIVMQILQGKNLAQKLKTTPNFTQTQIKQIMIQLLNGLAYLQDMNIIHRDLKPQNIVFRHKSSIAEPVIVDFGLAAITTINQHLFQICGTYGFIAPQILKVKDKKQTILSHCDIFSLGAIFYQLLTKRKLFKGKKNNLKLKFNFNNQCLNKINPLARDLLLKLLQIIPQNRINAKQALKHQYFTQQAQQDQFVQTVQQDQNQVLYNRIYNNGSFYQNGQQDIYFGNPRILSQRMADLKFEWEAGEFDS